MAMAVLFDFPISSMKTKSLHSNRSTNPRIRSFLPLHHQTRCSASRNSDPNYPQEEEVEELGVRAALSMLRFYKREISPILPKSCRYVPTCSEYSMEAYKKYGFAKGSVLMAWRICRCNPLGGSGFDPPRWFDEEKPSNES